jgi:hypothetical protein
VAQSDFAFRRRLELIDMNTTCECNACINMTALDLKIFLHYGEYLVQQIGDKTDLQGTDVILADEKWFANEWKPPLNQRSTTFDNISVTANEPIKD